MSVVIVKAMLIVRNGEKLLFSRGFDEVKKQAFLRPLGGHVEFGETGAETIKREMQEEVGCEALDVKFVSAIENLFTYNGKKGHEVILVYEGRLADASLYTKDSFMFMEGDRKSMAGWFSKADVEREGIPIYPPFAYFTKTTELPLNGDNTKPTRTDSASVPRSTSV